MIVVSIIITYHKPCFSDGSSAASKIFTWHLCSRSMNTLRIWWTWPPPNSSSSMWLGERNRSRQSERYRCLLWKSWNRDAEWCKIANLDCKCWEPNVIRFAMPTCLKHDVWTDASIFVDLGFQNIFCWKLALERSHASRSPTPKGGRG